MPKYRIMTRKEFQIKYGTSWRKKIDWERSMDVLFGRILTVEESAELQEFVHDDDVIVIDNEFIGLQDLIEIPKYFASSPYMYALS